MFQGAAKYRYRVGIQHKPLAVDSFGGEVENWTTHEVRWAAMETIGGTETVTAANQIKATASHKFTFRLFDGLRESNRLYWRGRTFDIVSIVPDLATREVVVMANEDKDGPRVVECFVSMTASATVTAQGE